MCETTNSRESSANSAFDPNLKNLADYLAARKRIITAREGFFFALRDHLRPEQRPDAKGLADGLWNSAARQIEDADWVTNAARGYLTIRENLASGRSFRLSVLQMGQLLRIGVRVPNTMVVMQSAMATRISSTFPDRSPLQRRLTSGDVMFDWSFDVPDLYDSALTMEATIFLVGTLFENTLQALLAPKEPAKP